VATEALTAPPDQTQATVEQPAVPKKAAAKGKPAKKDATSKGEMPDAQGPSVAAHPRAARSVARAKSWGGLAGFIIGGYLSLPTSTLVGAGLRALEAGVVCYVAVWAGAVFIWRRLVILELKGREQKLLAEAQSRLPAASASPAEQNRARAS
jgi:hypothetical protein